MSETSLTLVRHIAASPDALFEAVTQPELLARRMGPDEGPVLISESDPKVGGTFRIRFLMLNGEEHEADGVFTEVTRPDRVAMTWRWLGETEESLVEIDLKPTPDGTELTFTHSRLKDRATRDSHCQGWTGALDKLERLFA